MPVVADPVARLHHDEIEAQGQARQRRTIRKLAALQQPVRSRPNTPSLPVIDGLLGQPEVAVRPPADLDGDQGAGRAWVDGDQVELVPAHVDVPGQDRPAGRRQPVGDEGLGVVA